MFRYTHGNLLESNAEALVNTVNEVGIMGKGIALMFREKFPENANVYEQACKYDQVKTGKMLVVENLSLIGPKWIINFPTKKHWRNPSKLEWVSEGLKDLVRVLREKGIRSVALPPLGCGNGGLEWRRVRQEIERELSVLVDVEVLVYGPTWEYQNNLKQEGLEKLTPARALIVEIVRRYSLLGIECSNLEIQKLAWFLQRVVRMMHLKDPLRLEFSANKYGPYADQLRHLLDGLDGGYLHCQKRLSDAGPFEPMWIESGKKGEVESYLQSDSARDYLPVLEKTTAIIYGFESPLGMELLATVDWLITKEGYKPNVVEIRKGLLSWSAGEGSAARKAEIFDDRLLTEALIRLRESDLIPV